MQLANLIVMPMPNQKPRSPLRSDENPPYPEFAIEILREVSKSISEAISPIREDIGIMKYAMGTMETQLRSHGEKLDAIVGMRHTLTALETKSEKQDTKIETIEGHVGTVKSILWVLSALAAIAGTVAIILELVKHYSG
jgi:hypothetical protein